MFSTCRRFGCQITRKKLLLYMALIGLFLTLYINVTKHNHDDTGEYTKSIAKCIPREQKAKPNCYTVLNGNKMELELDWPKSKSARRHDPICPVSNLKFVMWGENCERFKKERNYIMYSSNKEEREFPIAYDILVYQHVEQVERLLQLIYRPQNTYCIHVDKNADLSVLKGLKAICNCFQNVFIASKLETIIYAGFSRLQADINCMKDALQKNSKWKYFINLSGEMFPLKSNLEIVHVLKTFNNSNDIQGTLGTNVQAEVQERWNKTKTQPPPEGITIVKGSAYGAFTREFVEFVLYNSIAQDFLNWTKDTYSPDEIFWSTLHYTNYNPHLNSPVGYAEESTKHAWRAVQVLWVQYYSTCHGTNLRGICIPGTKDLPKIVSGRELFFNKLKPFDYDYDVLECLEEWFLNKTKHFIPSSKALLVK